METLVQTPNYLLMRNNQAYNAIVKDEFFDAWDEPASTGKNEKEMLETI